MSVLIWSVTEDQSITDSTPIFFFFDKKAAEQCAALLNGAPNDYGITYDIIDDLLFSSFDDFMEWWEED